MATEEAVFITPDGREFYGTYDHTSDCLLGAMYRAIGERDEERRKLSWGQFFISTPEQIKEHYGGRCNNDAHEHVPVRVIVGGMYGALFGQEAMFEWDGTACLDTLTFLGPHMPFREETPNFIDRLSTTEFRTVDGQVGYGEYYDQAHLVLSNMFGTPEEVGKHLGKQVWRECHDTAHRHVSVRVIRPAYPREEWDGSAAGVVGEGLGEVVEQASALEAAGGVR